MNSPGDEPAVAVVVVTYRSAEFVGETLSAVAAELRGGDELVVIDNASGDGTAAAARAAAPEAVVLEQARNLGFAGGCNAGAAATSAPLLLFLNPDATPAPGCVEALRRAADEHPGWGAWQALVTLPGGREVNTSGGVTHFLGVGWAGRCGEPIDAAPESPTEVSFASGAALMIRREDWRQAGGFDERYFMYGEDLDLSLRLWLAGKGVGVVPAARVAHQYEFDKGSRKWLLLERNRWWTVLSDYPGALLLLLAPALAGFELALLAVAVRDGWLRQKLSAQLAVARELPAILARRREVQRGRVVSSAAFASHLTGDIDSPYLDGVSSLGLLVSLQRRYWAAVLWLLGRTGVRR